MLLSCFQINFPNESNLRATRCCSLQVPVTAIPRFTEYKNRFMNILPNAHTRFIHVPSSLPSVP
jgi:hypothetical protein